MLIRSRHQGLPGWLACRPYAFLPSRDAAAHFESFHPFRRWLISIRKRGGGKAGDVPGRYGYTRRELQPFRVMPCFMQGRAERRGGVGGRLSSGAEFGARIRGGERRPDGHEPLSNPRATGCHSVEWGRLISRQRVGRCRGPLSRPRIKFSVRFPVQTSHAG
ncbi:hypothetical protein VUR80DRAFT_7642 [Thermomyces stellatus]